MKLGLRYEDDIDGIYYLDVDAAIIFDALKTEFGYIIIFYNF
jgi:hypothetical protein